MKKVFITFLLYSLSTSFCFAQYFGFQGKRSEISAGMSLMSPMMINAYRYGIDKTTPSGFTWPTSYFAEYNFSISQHWGIGASIMYSNKNIVGYRFAAEREGP